MIHYSKIRNVIDPQRGTNKSAGIDFFVPKFTDDFINDVINKNLNVNVEFDLEKRCILLQGHDRILIPSGIHVKMPENTVLIAKNKSGISTKKGLDILACVIDEDYQGEIHISLLNTNNGSIEIFEDEKIVQFILFPIIYSNIENVNSIEELYEFKTERGGNGFGSTNK